NIKGLPDLASLESGRRLKLEKILELRETQAAQQFRDWLAVAPTKTDEEIKAEIDDATQAIGNFFSSKTGKTIRVLLSTLMGLANPLLGALTTAADTFGMDSVYPRSGPVAFINDMLPTALEPDKDPLQTGYGS